MRDTMDKHNRIWGADSVPKSQPLPEVVQAARKEFVRQLGREPNTTKEMLEYFTQSSYRQPVVDTAGAI